MCSEHSCTFLFSSLSQRCEVGLIVDGRLKSEIPWTSYQSLRHPPPPRQSGVSLLWHGGKAYFIIFWHTVWESLLFYRQVKIILDLNLWVSCVHSTCRILLPSLGYAFSVHPGFLFFKMGIIICLIWKWICAFWTTVKSLLFVVVVVVRFFE